MRSPKLEAASSAEQYYQYYAGYSDGFVDDMLDKLALPSAAVVLDPWNGAGTTTTAASRHGYHALGFDLNPAVVLIGRSRLLQRDTGGSLTPLAQKICEEAKQAPALQRKEVLDAWFGPQTSVHIRSVERAIYRLLVDADADADLRSFDLVFNGQLRQSSIASFFYVALFDTVRQLVRRYVPSNPTWIKSPDGRRLGVPQQALHAAFLASVAGLSKRLTRTPQVPSQPPSIQLAASTDLPLSNGEVDVVLSSPPYCTRLDYVKATLPELGVLGLDHAQVRELRDRMIGTTTMTDAGRATGVVSLGPAVDKLLGQVASHSSHASATYYRKYFLQYFVGMQDSLDELQRVLKPGGTAVLVVQDSYYKELHVDLPALLGDLSATQGWASASRTDFVVPKTMAAIHPGSRAYRKRFGAVESALMLRRP